MVRSLAEGAAVESSTGGRRHDAIVARFERFLEANPDRPLYLTEICAAIGVAERTLRASCEEHLGMGPIRYLTLRRMHLARRALLRADPSKSTVTRIVTDHGFWELGRFSVAYRMLFGEFTLGDVAATRGAAGDLPQSAVITRSHKLAGRLNRTKRACRNALSAGWTMAWSRRPKVSTRMCRFLPLISAQRLRCRFLPASYPCGSIHAPFFRAFHAVYFLACLIAKYQQAISGRPSESDCQVM